MRAINVLLLRHRHSLILPGESGIERMQLQFCHDESLPRAQLDAFRKCIFPLVTWKMFLLDNHKIAQATWRYLAVLKVEFQGEIITKKESHFSEESVHCKLQNCGLSKKKEKKGKRKKEKKRSGINLALNILWLFSTRFNGISGWNSIKQMIGFRSITLHALDTYYIILCLYGEWCARR